MYAINKQGLREKPNYDELVNYLQNKQEKIVYPDRFAKRIRESPQLSNLLDGEGFDIHDIQDQQIRQAKEIAKNLAIIQADGDAKILNTASKEPSRVNNNIADHTEAQNDLSDVVGSFIDTLYQKAIKKVDDITEKNKEEHLDHVDQQQRDALLGMAPPKPPPPKSEPLNEPEPIYIGTPPMGPAKAPPSKGRPKKEPDSEAPIDTEAKPPPKQRGRPKTDQPLVPVPSKASSSKASSSNDPIPKVDATNIRVPRGIIEETSTSSGSGNGNGASSGDSQPLDETQPIISSENKQRIIALELKTINELRRMARQAVRSKGRDTFFINRLSAKSDLIRLIIEPEVSSSSAPPPGPPQRPITSELIKTLLTQYKKDQKNSQ